MAYPAEAVGSGPPPRASAAPAPTVCRYPVEHFDFLPRYYDRVMPRPVRAESERLPFPERTFDRVLVVDALHHFVDQRVALGDRLRVLRPDGRLVIAEPDATRPAVKLVALVEKLALMRSRFYTPEAIRDMIAAHGTSASVERGRGFAA